MSINWSDYLIQEIAYRRVILFLGSGISATAKNDAGESPLTWEDFITRAQALLDNPTPEILAFIKDMITQKNYLMALQVIFNKTDQGKYSHFINEVFSRQNFKSSDVHQYIKDIDCKITITTNFDRIYDILCNEHGYTTATYMESKKIIINLKSTQNIIIKAHGNIDDIPNIVFTQEQYYRARMENPEFYQLLNSLFLTHTALFLGYSLNDPDINLILENVANSTSPSTPHYIVVKEGVHEQIKEHWLKSYNMSCIEYGPNYSDLDDNILKLSTLVSNYRASKRMP
jgi:hypothetical protein